MSTEQPAPPPSGQSSRLSHAQPPAVLRHVANPVLRAVLESPLRTPLGKALAVVTYLGRRSSQRYRVVVGYRDLGDGVFRVWTNGGWRVNFRGEDGHPATLRIHGVDRPVTGRLVEDEATVVAEAYGYLSGGGDPRRLGLTVQGEGPVTQADVRAIVPPLSYVQFRHRSAAG